MQTVSTAALPRRPPAATNLEVALGALPPIWGTPPAPRPGGSITRGRRGGLGDGSFRPPSLPVRCSSGDRSAGYTGFDDGGAAKQLHRRRSRRTQQREQVKEAVGQGWRFAKQILPWSLTCSQVRAFPRGSCFRSQRGKCEGGTPSPDRGGHSVSPYQIQSKIK